MGRSRRRKDDINYRRDANVISNESSLFGDLLKSRSTDPSLFEVLKSKRMLSPEVVTDRRRWHPFSSVQQTAKKKISPIARNVNRQIEPDRVERLQRKELVCARRRERREVLFAFNHTGSGSGSRKRPVFNDDSKIRCKR